ncbi:MAG: bifunctional DNA-formamidopyrimidine glycosylase/DNA-(apurinic or apyrimidinic site) lyase [Patescibacteria group bacterium]
MPELPEVETLRRELVEAVKGKIIKSAEVRWAKMVRPLSEKEFDQKLKNKKITDVKRRAKILIFDLSGKDFLMVHLKLTGQLIFQKLKIKGQKSKVFTGGHPQKDGVDNLPNKFTHIIITFKDGSKLYFNDLRKFGWMRITDKEGIEKLSGEFGLEPLLKEFTLEKFKAIIKKYPKRKIKQILLDQTLIAGIGNIYADESAFDAGILPIRPAGKIKEAEANKLYQSIKKILKLSLSKKGTSADTYVQLNGQPGGFVPYLKVYGRKGEKCKKCDGMVKRIKVNGRGTHFCEKCQK